MFKDRKIKKMIDEEMKPTVSAEQFCLDAGITFENKEIPKRETGRKWFRLFLPIATVAVVCLSIALPLSLSGGDSFNRPKYGENDIQYEMTGIEKLYADESVIMFNQSYVQIEGTQYVITPLDSSMKLGYKVSDVTYAEIIDGTPTFVVTFDYLIRCYEGYTISSAEVYSNMDRVYTLNDFSFNYCIVENSASSIAYVTFKNNKYDYYIDIRSYCEITEINDDSVQLFLRKAFVEEKQKDETVNGRQVDS